MSGKLENNIVVRDGESMTLVFTSSASEVRTIVVEKGATLKITELYTPTKNASLQIHISQAFGSKVELVFVECGSGSAKIDYTIDLNEEQAEVDFYGLFLTNDDEKTELGVRVNHNAPSCRSNELVKGIASGSSHGRFKGYIYVKQDAQKTEAYQQSRNLILSDLAKIEAQPQLEIYADDVICNHGATIGQINADEIYYMRQRGIDEATAKKLLLEGFVNDIILHCTDEKLCAQMRELANNKIARM